LEYVDYEDPVTLTVLRGQDLITFSLRSSEEPPAPKKGRP
jgi:hypothetical protein